MTGLFLDSYVNLRHLIDSWLIYFNSGSVFSNIFMSGTEEPKNHLQFCLLSNSFQRLLRCKPLLPYLHNSYVINRISDYYSHTRWCRWLTIQGEYGWRSISITTHPVIFSLLATFIDYLVFTKLSDHIG